MNKLECFPVYVLSFLNNNSDHLTLLDSEWHKLYGVLAVMSAVGLK